MREGQFEVGDPCPACRRSLIHVAGLWCPSCGTLAEGGEFQPPEVSLYALRKEGWRVGAHAEYEDAGGQSRVLWIFARAGQLVRGEGRDAAEALEQVRTRIQVMPSLLPAHPAVARPNEPLSREQHIVRHKDLHTMFDELLADFISCTRRMPSKTTLTEFMDWSCRQTIDPEDPRGFSPPPEA